MSCIKFRFDPEGYNGNKYQLPHAINSVVNIMAGSISMYDDVKAVPKPKVITTDFLKLLSSARSSAPKDTDRGYDTKASKILNGIACKNLETPVLKFLDSILIDQDKRRQLLAGKQPTQVDKLPPSSKFFADADKAGQNIGLGLERKENQNVSTMQASI